jgi:hypothetical protein
MEIAPLEISGATASPMLSWMCAIIGSARIPIFIKQWVILNIGKKTDLPGPAAFGDCSSVLFLGDLEGLAEPRSIW